MNRRDFMRLAGLGVLAAGMPGFEMAEGASPSSGKPNIIFVLGDDMGIDSRIGCYGSGDNPSRTPNLDALAAGGIRFERCFASVICGPTRCLIMTGRYPFRTGGWDHGPGLASVLPQNEYPLARILKEAGYSTCSVGKWRQLELTPRDWGFDEYVTDPTPAGFYWLDESKQKYDRNGTAVSVKNGDKPVFYPDICHDYAMEFIRAHGAGGKSAGKPFFLYYPSHIMHEGLRRTPTSAPDADRETIVKDNLIYLDRQIGEMVAELDRLNLRDNTLIVFAGDNGTAKGTATSPFIGCTLNGRRISGVKGQMLEGGALVPFIVNWKGGAPGGRVVKDLVDFTDLLATFTELAGAKLPQTLTYDGRSLLPLLRGEPFTPREWIFVGVSFGSPMWYVREDKWKLDQSGKLFDMKDAPFAEPLVPANSKSPEAVAARKRLQAVLDKLNPAAGKLPPRKSDNDDNKE